MSARDPQPCFRSASPNEIRWDAVPYPPPIPWCSESLRGESARTRCRAMAWHLVANAALR